MRGRPQGFWIAVAFAASAVGLALDKGFADNTPPYDEPLIAPVRAANRDSGTTGAEAARSGRGDLSVAAVLAGEPS